MTEVKNTSYQQLKDIFDLKYSTDEEGTIENIKKSIDFKGENVWALIFAIFIASIGLNTNSTAVIIGAMLISPLMGPIVGAGLAVGINDIETLKRSLKSLAIAVIVSILTSTLYFSISPLEQIQSELLARTNPTIFDVLIAIFGGGAGIVASSRRDKGNAIPGVAIATALMPPLCTAGFGLASGNFRFFAGAFYLFLINSIFICLSTLVFVKYLHFKEKEALDQKRSRQVKNYLMLFVIITIIPSIYTAWNVVNQTVFISRAHKFVNENIDFTDTKLISFKTNYNYNKSSIELNLIGEPISSKTIEALKHKMEDYKIYNTDLVVNQPKNSLSKVEEQFNKMNKDLKLEIIESLYKQNNDVIEAKDKQITELQKKINNMENQKSKSNQLNINKIIKEAKIYNPAIIELTYSAGFKANIDNKDNKNISPQPNAIVLIKWKKKPDKNQLAKLELFLRTATEQKNLQIVHL